MFPRPPETDICQSARRGLWLILAAVVISAGNAVMRKAHVRIDFIFSQLSARTNAIIDAVGMVVFLIPMCLILISLSWPVFERSWVSGEMSQNAGGLIRWPVKSLIPLGFGILQNDTLLAIPFFTFMGIILERSGMAEDLLETVGQVFGPMRGGLAVAVISMRLIS